MREIPFEAAREVWRKADQGRSGGNTLGILDAFAPPHFTTQWGEGEILAREVGDLYFIGGLPTDNYAQLTGGTHRVGDVTDDKANQQRELNIDPSLRLVLVRDPATQRHVILDGNNRALSIDQAVKAGRLSGETKIPVILGDLTHGITFRARAIAPLWR